MADTPRRVTRAAAAAASSAVRPELETHDSTASSAPSSREDSPEATTTITTVHHYRRRRSAAGIPEQSDEGDASGAEHVTSTTKIHHTGGASTHEVGKDGSISIRPMPRGGRRLRRFKIRKVVNFKHRTSTFDRSNADSTSDQFRGFYTLFWIFLAVGTFRTLQSSYEHHGSVLGTGFFRLFSEDAKVLALTDAALVGSSLLCVPFAKVLQRGWIRYHYTGLVIQHLGQTLWLAGWIRWTFFRCVLPSNVQHTA